MEDFVYRARPWAITLALHNWPILLYAAAIPVAALLAYLRPSRRRILLLYGLLVLAFAFEYQKHGAAVAQDTIDYLLSEYANPTARHLAGLVIVQAMPLLLHALGLALILGAALLYRGRPLLGSARTRSPKSASRPGRSIPPQPS